MHLRRSRKGLSRQAPSRGNCHAGGVADGLNLVARDDDGLIVARGRARAVDNAHVLENNNCGVDHDEFPHRRGKRRPALRGTDTGAQQYQRQELHECAHPQVC